MRKICLLLMLMIGSIAIAQPLELRLLNHWDNPDGTVERGYAGRSIWKWELIPADDTPLPDSLRVRYEEYGRINRHYGINGTVLNNVNAKPQMLSSDMLRKTAKIADCLRPYGIRVYLSVNFASPKALGGLSTADPLDRHVRRWWKRKTKEIYRLIPDFGGFLVKANSEGEPGPMDYGRTHADGANLLAEALRPYGGIVMWRAFVYNAQGGDRANQACEEFVPLDGQFASNVVIQIKNGPIDFQPLEPVSPLFFNLKKTKMMAELQITQEYTGESIHTCYLAPMWSDFFRALQRFGVPLTGVAGVANIGEAANWTGNDLARANWMAFGHLASNPEASPESIARDFLQETYTDNPHFVEPMSRLLCESHAALVGYMMPMGLHHIFAGGHHYGPEPWCAPAGWREDWLPRYYHRADTLGIGINRSSHSEPCVAGSEGSDNVAWYPQPLRSEYDDINTCPDSLLLWFHHVGWNHRLRNGQTLWEALCKAYDDGVRKAEGFVKTWETMRPYVDTDRFKQQLTLFERQAKDAWWWRDACLLYFQKYARQPLPAVCPPPRHALDDLMRFHLGIDNYTAAPIELLP